MKPEPSELGKPRGMDGLSTTTVPSAPTSGAAGSAAGSRSQGVGHRIRSALGKIGRGDLLFLGLLVFLGVKVNGGLGIVNEIQFADESFYLWHGVELNIINPQFSPLYCGWYFLLSLIQPDRLELYFLSWFLLPLMMAVGAYLLVRSLGGAEFPAFLCGAVLLLSRISDVTPRPMHFAVSLLCLGLAVAFSFRALAPRLAVATLTVGLAAFARPEFAISFIAMAIVMAAVLVWEGYRRREARVSLAIWAMVGLMPVLQLFQLVGNPLAGGRSDIAFSQHYSYNKYLAGLREEGANPWSGFLPVVKEDFGKAPIGITEAAQTSPGNFAWHVSQNVVALFANLRDLATSLSHTVTDVLWGYLALLSIAALALAIVSLRGRGWRGLASGAVVPALVMLLVIAPVLAACLLIHPREHYLVALFSALLVCASVVVGKPLASWRSQAARRSAIIAAGLIVLYAPHNFLNWEYEQLASKSYRTAWEHNKKASRTIEFIRQIPFEGRLRVIEGGFSLFAYTNLDFEFHGVGQVPAGQFAGFLDKHKINTVVSGPKHIVNRVLRNDEGFQRFYEGPPPPGWVVFKNPDIPCRIAVRREALTGPIETIVARPDDELRLASHPEDPS